MLLMDKLESLPWELRHHNARNKLVTCRLLKTSFKLKHLIFKLLGDKLIVEKTTG